MFIPEEKKMYCYVNLMIILTLYVPLIYSQAEIITLSKPPYYCGNKLSLKCNLSSACCNTLTRSWRKDGTEIISNGAETTTSGKYSETVVDAENYFTLTINDIKDDDFGKGFICLYAGYTSAEIKLEENDLLCPPCGICIAICLACALGGMIGVCLLEYATLLCSSLLTKLPCHNNCSVSYNGGDSHYIFCGKDYSISKKKKSLLIAILVNAVGLILYGLIPGLCFGWFCYICYVELAPLLLLFALGALLFIVIFYWTLEFHSDEKFSIWRYLGYVALTFLILPLIVLVPYMCCKGGNTQSAKSVSSCWPPCRVDQDPETRSHGPVNVGRSSERPTPNKEKGKKPVARVSSQPQTAHHIKTENTASAVLSTENEIFKPRPLPDINMHKDPSTPRPLPKMTPVTQQEKASNKLDPIETTGEKKKKKKRRKKETDQTKQTEVENSTEL